MWPALLSLLLSGDCHGLNIAIDLILTSVNAMVSGDDFIDFIANLEKFYWLIGVTEEIKSPCGCRGFGWLGSSIPIVIQFNPTNMKGHKTTPSQYNSQHLNRAPAHPDCLALMLGQ